MNMPNQSQWTDLRSDMSYIPHIGWLSHQPNEELIALLQRGYFEAAEQAFFWLYLRPGDCFIDCGAHIGLYSVLSHRATGGKIGLVSVEPDPKSFSFLKENMESTGLESVQLVNAAVWNTSGEIGFVNAGSEKAAYSHIAFDKSTDASEDVKAVTLDSIVSTASCAQIALMKIDVEGAEPEVLNGGAQVISEHRCPLIMIEFTEANLARRGMTSIQLAALLENFGYELCEFSAEALTLCPFRVEGPVWFKNIFACIDRSAVNARLATASAENSRIARDVLARARACSLYAELEELQKYKKLAELVAETKTWAERTEQLLTQERQTSTHLREWAERADLFLKQERQMSTELRQWAERTESFLFEERNSNEMLKSELNGLRPFVRAFNPLFRLYRICKELGVKKG